MANFFPDSAGRKAKLCPAQRKQQSSMNGGKLCYSKLFTSFPFSFKLVIFWWISDPGSKGLLPEYVPGLLVSRRSLLVLLVCLQLLQPNIHTPPGTWVLTRQLSPMANKIPERSTGQIYTRRLRNGRNLLCFLRATWSPCRIFTRQQHGLQQVRINRMLLLSGPGGIR